MTFIFKPPIESKSNFRNRHSKEKMSDKPFEENEEERNEIEFSISLGKLNGKILRIKMTAKCWFIIFK